MLLRISLAALAILTLVFPVQSGCPTYENNQLFTGKGTYYGVPPMPPNTHVHCHLPNNMFGLTTIAMNRLQYDASKACGMCIRVYGHGKVCPNGNDPGDNSCGMGRNPIAGTFDAVVTDELVERPWGDIDLGKPGDGFWGVAWHPIPCPTANHGPAIVLHPGSNRYYMKVQARYLDSPMKWMEANGERSPTRTHDNFFEFTKDGAGFKYENGKIVIRVMSQLGTTYCGHVDEAMNGEDYEYNMGKCE